MTETPAHIELVRSFVNTMDVEEGTDGLTTPEGLGSWLAEHGLWTGSARPDAELVTAARALRDQLRAILIQHHDETETTDEQFNAVAGRFPLRLNFSGRSPGLAPSEGGLRGALAWVLVAVANGLPDGSWERLKICQEETCQWAFYDASRNHSRQWCSMQVCGNRNKTRTYRARKKTTAE